ncbi:MAG TPA: 30S ribosomal protein S6 [Pseudobdellovibrionaceae bacterium]|nr:30S ribosomal protein S6 [Pseudobdellovibrionaceae bacterium]
MQSSAMAAAKETRPYEVIVLMHPDASEDEQKSLFRKNKSIIEEQFGGQMVHLDTWGKRTLANAINKTKKAYYFHATFKAQPAAIAELERTMRINDRVLRFMHTALDVRTDLNKYLEDFRTSLAAAAQREREREAKFQARRAMQRPGGRREEGGGRRDFDAAPEMDVEAEGELDEEV